ncbi:hypothetical protein DVH05_020150 [Phytophthora capsici]|nr:hypothetical protein DVH05_020150 [Phytophthora capsici]
MNKQLDVQHTLNNVSARLALVEAYLGLNVASDVEPPQIQAYDDYVDTYLPPFLEACKKLGDHTTQLGGILEKAFVAQREFLVKASQSKKPQAVIPADFESLSKVQLYIDKVQELRDNRSEFVNHQNMVYEAVQSLGWLCVERTPKPAVDSFVEGLDFWGNKIRLTKKPDHIAFVTTLKTLLTELSLYIKMYHLVGVTWSTNAIDIPVKNNSSPDNVLTVPKEKDVHTPVIVEASSKRIQIPSKSSTHSPICEERNGNWQIEYQTGSDPLTVSGINMKQQVYIYGCEGATILLEGKAKNIVLDSCTRTKLIFDSAVSCIEIINCKRVQVQCKELVPSISIDKTDGCLVYISWEGRGVQFVTSKSSEMNVMLPVAANSDNYVEKPIPEQFVHTITDDLSMSSNASTLYS